MDFAYVGGVLLPCRAYKSNSLSWCPLSNEKMPWCPGKMKCFEANIAMPVYFFQDTNVLGFKGPRKMTIVIPGMGPDHKRIPVKPKTVGFLSRLMYVHTVTVAAQ